MSATTSAMHYESPKSSVLSAATQCAWFLVKLGIAAAAIFGICVAVFLVAADAAAAHVKSSGSTQFVPVQVTRTLIDDNERVLDDSWTVYRFTLDRSTEVSLSLNVTYGDAVSAYVLDESSYANFPSGDWKQHEVFRAAAKRAHNAVGALGPGRYVLVVKESSDPNILFGSDSAFVGIRLTAKTIELRSNEAR